MCDAAVQCRAQRLDHSPDRKVQLKYICCGVGDPSPPRRHRLHSVSSGVEGGSSFPCRALNNAHLSGDGHFCVMRVIHVGHMNVPRSEHLTDSRSLRLGHILSCATRHKSHWTRKLVGVQLVFRWVLPDIRRGVHPLWVWCVFSNLRHIRF